MIELKNVSKSFDDKKVLDSFSAVFEDGIFLKALQESAKRPASASS